MEEINQIRVTNLVTINLPVLLMVPFYIYLLGYEISYASYAMLGGYIFIFFSFWFFILFIYKEIKYSLKNKINFFKHVISNKLVFWGIFPILFHFIIYSF